MKIDIAKILGAKLSFVVENFITEKIKEKFEALNKHINERLDIAAHNDDSHADSIEKIWNHFEWIEKELVDKDKSLVNLYERVKTLEERSEELCRQKAGLESGVALKMEAEKRGETANYSEFWQQYARDAVNAKADLIEKLENEIEEAKDDLARRNSQVKDLIDALEKIIETLDNDGSAWRSKIRSIARVALGIEMEWENGN